MTLNKMNHIKEIYVQYNFSIKLPVTEWLHERIENLDIYFFLPIT